MDPTTLARISGEIQINQENCQDVLSASNMLGLSDVVQACCDFLQKELHPSNCVGESVYSDVSFI